MSTNATFGQAGHTLTIVGQQEPTVDHLKVLHDGYLADLVRAIKNGTVPARDTFQKFLGLLPELKAWKTIRLGLHKAPETYEQALEAKGFRISDCARQILKKITVSQTVVEVDLCVLTVAELGLKGNAARYDTICARIVEIGGMLCPDEVGPALREQYPDQPYGEWNAIATEPLSDSGGNLGVFGVGRGNGGRWLGTYCGDPDDLFGLVARIVALVPRK